MNWARGRFRPGVLLAGALCVTGCGQQGPSPAELAQAAAREAERAADAQAREARAAALEVQRLAALWTYHETPVGSGRQRTAAIRSTENVDTDGQGAHPVQLVFRDHPSWGRSSYLVLQAGDFDCYGRCTVGATADAGPPARLAGRRPETDEAIAMFVTDARALWHLTAGATSLSIEFPVKAGGTRTATFSVAGLDQSRMPGWSPDLAAE